MTDDPRRLAVEDVLTVGLRALVLTARNKLGDTADEVVRDTLNTVIHDLNTETAAAPAPDLFALCVCDHLIARHTSGGGCVTCGCDAPRPKTNLRAVVPDAGR